eukprot:10730173-Lingulodinium_polyedra.AAC.1
MEAIKNAKRAADLEEEAETPEVTGSSPRRVVQRTEGAGEQDGPSDAPMIDAGSIDPADVAFEDLGNDSSATDDPVK